MFYYSTVWIAKKKKSNYDQSNEKGNNDKFQDKV